MKFSKLSLLLLIAFACFACEDDDDGIDIINNNEPEDVTGLNYVAAEDGSFNTIYGNLITALEDVDAISIVAQVDHDANATGAGLTLDNTHLVLFGNPNLGTPLMQANQRVGLDLPQKMLVYQAEDDDIIIAYNNTDYLAQRHNISSVATLEQIGAALGNFAQNAGDDNVVNADDDQVNFNEGIVEVSASDMSVDEVYDNLIAAINGNANLRIIAELDHAANATSVGMELRPTKLVVFGNPALGTSLMQDEQSVAIDLPQKMLIYEDAEGNVKLIYNDPAYFADRHDGLDDDLEQLTTITNALSNLAAAATSN